MMSSPSSRLVQRRRAWLLGSVPIVTLGLLLVTAAMLTAPWPSDPKSLTGTTVSFRERLLGEQPHRVNGDIDQTAAWYGRRILDALALVLLLLAYTGLSLMMVLDEWRALLLLALIGAVGTLYGGSAGLVLGPIVTTAGFALMLWGAGLNLISRYAVEASCRNAVQIERESTYDTHFAPQP